MADANDQLGKFDGFWTITTALAVAQQQMRHLGAGMLSPAVFLHQNAVEDRIKCSTDAYSSLERLCLDFHPYTIGFENNSASDNLSGLQRLLVSATRLRSLMLCFPKESLRGGAPFALKQVFPGDGKWELLTTMNLTAMSTSAKDFMLLLILRMPELRYLKLSEIVLLQGRWEGVIETMKRSMPLHSFLTDSSLSHLGGQKFTGEVAEGLQESWSSTLEKYVVKGGRHPCLLPDEPDLASEKYLSEPWL